ncbi:glycosyltransferase [Streptomyces sp. NPDC046716]|uniref:glycosyltransferase n=1 Tax=Streptomyces sp. NPDC046716 TaxID=3157093 RepID=UPI0033D8DD63
MSCRAVAVIVPAHNEAPLIAACLRSVREAARHVAPLPVVVVVVADACSDATATVAAEHGAVVLRIDDHNVGAARAAGARHTLRLLGDVADALWLAMTDADTTVPDTWLTHQITWADQDYDAVLGTIRLAASPPATTVRAALHDAAYFHTRPPAGSAPWRHPHVHGANLGVAAAAYQHIGGFAELPTGEDHDLVTRLLASGHRIVRTDGHPVRTAARTSGRAPGGLADLLARLEVGGELAPSALNEQPVPTVPVGADLATGGGSASTDATIGTRLSDRGRRLADAGRGEVRTGVDAQHEPFPARNNAE